MTFRQALALDAHVRLVEHGTTVFYANLVDAEEGYSLVWSRNTRPAN
jgi:antirestriction protein ArdC